MGLAGFAFTFFLLILNLVGTLRLKNRMPQLVELELLVLIIGLLLWLITLLGLYFHKRWAWNWNTVLFSLSLVNLLFLYVLTGSSLTFVFVLGVNLFGLITSIIGLELYIPDEDFD